MPENTSTAIPPVPDAAELLQGAIESLNYCTDCGVAIDQQIVDDIVSAANDPASATPKTFKGSLYGSISRLEDLKVRVQSSISASEGWELKRKLSPLEKWIFRRIFQSYASMAQSTFLIIAMLVAFVLYQAQERLYLGHSLYSDAIQLQERENTDLSNLSKNDTSKGSDSATNQVSGANVKDTHQIGHRDKTSENADDFNAYINLLKKWARGCNSFPLNMFIPIFLMDDDSTKPIVAGHAPQGSILTNTSPVSSESTWPSSLQQAVVADESFDDQRTSFTTQLPVYKFLVDLLTSYICPCLGGVLGSSVYVLRMINLRTIKHDLSDRCISTYLVRLFLGGIFGTVISWFIGSGGTPDAWKSLPPLALSFITGYNIEIVFTAMDKLIGTFSPSSPITLQENQPRG